MTQMPASVRAALDRRRGDPRLVDKKHFICDDCEQSSKLKTSTMLVHSQTFKAHYVCAVCVKKYNIKIPH